MRKTMSIELTDEVMMVLHEISVHAECESQSHEIFRAAQVRKSFFNLAQNGIVEELIFQFYFLAIDKCRH
jgi:hypothetical protein